MRGQTGLPLWAAGVLAGLFVPVVVPFELVFGDGVGALAAGGGVVIGRAAHASSAPGAAGTLAERRAPRLLAEHML